ncbi:MAG: hypothetical protein ACOC70_00940, partial [bacterium]
MNLDQLLGSMTVEQLQDMLVVWAPERPTSNSKMALFRSLRTEMTRPERVGHCLERAGSLGRGILRKLLRSEHLSQSVSVLAASSAARPRSIEETRAAVADLAAMGLVCVEPEKRWETYGAARVTLPDELVEPLRGATGIGERPWQEVLHLADHLAALSADERGEALRSVDLDLDPADPVDELAARLADRACADRLAGLSGPLRRIVRRAIEQRAGLVRVERLGTLDEDVSGVDDETLGRWRAELEANFAGTVGDVSLLDFGIDLDGRVLAVFTEVVEAWLATPLADRIDLRDPVGPDFLLDLAELVQCARESVAKLKMSGALTAPASDRIIARMNRGELPLMDAYELLELRVACAEKRGLVERAGDMLAAKRAAWEWERRSYEEQAADLFDLVGFAVPAPRSEHHHDGLCGVARELLRSMAPGEWRRGGALEGIALRRYLARLPASGLRETIADAVKEVSEYVLPPFPGLAQLAETVRRAVVMEAYAMGVLDVMAEDGRAVAERLSEFGAVAAGVGPTAGATGKLIVTPDFEAIVLPEGDTTRLRYEVGQVAVREKVEQTYH